MSLLLTQEQVVAAMELDRYGVIQAIERGGYEAGTDILGSRFLGMNMSGLFVYQISHDVGEDLPGTGQVYVSYKREPMSKEVYLSAEY